MSSSWTCPATPRRSSSPTPRSTSSPTSTPSATSCRTPSTSGPASASGKPRVAILSAVETVTTEDPLDHRGRRALQDGRPRPDHRRPARRPARLRQRHRPRGGADQGDHVAGGRARADPRRARPRGRQHAGEEPDLPRPCRRRRHRARRAGADRADLARRLGPHPARLLRRRLALRRRPAASEAQVPAA